MEKESLLKFEKNSIILENEKYLFGIMYALYAIGTSFCNVWQYNWKASGLSQRYLI